MEEKSLRDLLNQFWSSNRGDTNDIQVMLKKAKLIIKDWSKGFKSDSKRRMRWLEEHLDKEEQKTDPGPETSTLRKELEHLYDVKEELLKQKSRLIWSLKGDRNTSFFHQVVQRRNNRNKICKIFWEDS